MRASALIFLLAACDKVLGFDPITAPTSYRKQITVTQNTGATLIDFVLLLQWGNDPDLAAHAASNQTIEFVDADGAPLAYDISSFGERTGQLDAWVHLPSLPPGETTFWMVYSAKQVSPSTSPWFGPYAGVWHESGSSAKEPDRTNSGHDLAATTSQFPASVAGIVGGARSYDGVAEPMCDSHLNASLDFGGSSFSYSAWVQAPVLPASSEYVVNKGGSSSGDPGYDVELAGLSTAQINDQSSGHVVAAFGALQANAWSQLVVVVDRDRAGLLTYADGMAKGSSAIDVTFGSVAATTPFCVGADAGGNRPLLGTVDEVRVYNVALAAEWIAFEYQNVTQTDRVIAVGPEQHAP